MDERELRGPSLGRAFAPLWVVVGLLVLVAVVLPLVLTLLVAVSDISFTKG